VIINKNNDAINANGRFARGDWKKIRSTQYWICQTNAAIITTDGIHALRLITPQNKTPPTAPQPAPVADKYNGLRRASNSLSTSQKRKAAKNLTAPHADRINTNHRSRVTPKGRWGDIAVIFSIYRGAGCYPAF